MPTQARTVATTGPASGNQTLRIEKLPAKRRQLKKRAIAGLQKFAIVGWELAAVLAEAQQVFAPYRGEFRSFLEECGVSSSHGYALVDAYRRSQELQPEVLQRFSGPTALMSLGKSHQALLIAKKRASEGELITVDVAKSIAAELKPRKTAIASAVKVPVGELATIVIHPRKDSDTSALQRAIKELIDRFEKEDVK